MHDRGDRGRARSYDSGGGAGSQREEKKRTPEEESSERVYRVWQEVESAASRAQKLPAIARREEWRTAHEGLRTTYYALTEALDARALDAKVSARAQEHYTNAVTKLGSIATVLETAQEPRRSVPPVAGEEVIEASVIDHSAPPQAVLTWVAGLDLGERTALASRVASIGGGSVDRRDGFAVALANYFADPRIRSQCADLRSKFLKIAKNPRRTEHEMARARVGATTRTDEPRAVYGGGIDGAPSPAPSELPYRAEMERSFGRPLGHVQAYTGMAAELAPHGAQGLATGSMVAFADTNPSPAIVAHEVTHTVQNEQAGTAAPMAAGVVAPRDSAGEAEADAMAGHVTAHGPGVRLPPITAAPAAHIQLAPKLLVPAADSPPATTIQVPDADHPSRRDIDGDQAIQTDKASEPGKAAPLRGKAWKSVAEVADSVAIQDDSGDTLRIEITYRLESRPAELSDIPDLWIHTERKALLTIGSGEHAGATIIGQARIRLAPEEASDPRAAIAKASVGADHWAQLYLAEAKQYVNLHGPGGRASLLADAADNDVLAYGDPLRMLVGLKNILKQQHVAGHGGDVAKTHARAQRLLTDAKRGRAVLEREIASVASHHDRHPGSVTPVRFLVGDIASWLAANQHAGRDDTEDANQLRKAHAELEHLVADAENAHAPKRDQLDDALSAPVRLAERTADGVEELGAMVLDAAVLGVDAIGEATGIGTFDYHPISKYGTSIDATGSTTTAALVAMVNGFADEWSDAIERGNHGDYRSLTDVSIDTLMTIDGARAGGVIALDKAEALAEKLGNVAKSARVVVQSTYASASVVPAEVRNIAAAMADGADAFVARLRAGGMQMAAAGDGGGAGPHLGGLSSEALAEAAQAAKEAFKDKRLTQNAAKQTENHGAKPAADAPRSSDDREHGVDAQPSSPVSDSARPDEEFPKPLERKPFQTRDGAQVEVVEQGRAVVPTGKVDIYPRGKVKPFTKEMAHEFKALKNERQTARKEFDKDPRKAERIEELTNLQKNVERSREMAKSLEEAGLPDTPAVNDEVARHLLEVGQKINESNRVRFPSELTGTAGRVKLLSTWVILPDGRALLSTVNVIPR